MNNKIYLIDIKIDENQILNSPWFSDFKFTLQTKIYKWNILLDKKIEYKNEYNFIELTNILTN